MRLNSLVIFLILSVTSHAAYINPATKVRLNQLFAEQNATRSDEVNEEEYPYEPMILEIETNEAIERLREAGVIFYGHRNELYLTSIPIDMIGYATSIDGVRTATSASFEVNSCMDIARPFSKVDDVKNGAYELPQAYDGTGVVVGFSDIGFDATHIAFKDRISQIHHIDACMGIEKSAVTPAEIAAWTTDNPNEYHATHVGNILAGNYRGNDYYGVATGAELVATTSGLDYVSILAGVERIIAYAKEQKKPAVINLSLSDPLGPRDGTDVTCRYLSYCAEDAIICISAGNSGHLDSYAGRNLADGDAKVTLLSYTRDVKKISGYVDIWSDGDEPFEYCVGIYDRDTDELKYTSAWVETGDSLKISSESDAEFAQYYEGTIEAYSDLCINNYRYNITIRFDVTSLVESDKYHLAKYYGYVSARRKEDCKKDINVDMFRGSSSIIFSPYKGDATICGAQASINNMCCAEGVVSVGMATSRNEAPSITNGTQSWNLPVDQVTKYSSYSDVPGIKRLPHFAAPGCYVMSAISNFYLENNPEKNVGTLSEVDGTNYYWYPDGGTSMAAPFTAGIMALWLQADNTLTSERAIDIAMETAKTDFTDIDNPRWGAGCIDALAGIKEVILQAGTIDRQEYIYVGISPDRHLTIEGISSEKVNVYTITGREIDKSRELQPGVYIISYPGSKPYKKIVR